MSAKNKTMALTVLAALAAVAAINSFGGKPKEVLSGESSGLLGLGFLGL